MRIVLVGAGLAAQRCAETLRQLGHDGPIAMYGDELPYDRPPLSKDFLKGERPELRFKPDAWYRDNDVDFVQQRVTSLDHLEFDRALIATGAEPITLDAFPHALTLRTRQDAIALDEALTSTRHLAIIGAGLIGQEVASAATARGIRTTLVDLNPRPFDALMGPGGGDRLRALHERHGVELRLGQNSGPLNADTILVAVGVKPAWRPDPAPGVFHAGDVTGSAHWEAAVVGGQNAARRMLGLQPKPEQPPLVWSDQYGVRIQRVGDPRGATHNGDLTYSQSGRLKAVVLMNEPHRVREARRDLKEAA
ncbi:FAD-dependent oxidoreductase [Solirubrobacter sp. CPCC 204708]|uniref:FAD-dependent oxidoreductase n=1 Tax=Solirubrobacter deserti TaxID=2282478 RepID=A0ABT4RLR9_9ACTN|nr:FAD-dependent oxidoreductase [Solirubrobacter deserti]MBE2316766.1 FAD-dependent oxidoreductase [Solirubrobacter deserti]MDA0139523.1 FAD-dependent oxidoreductase [Solirubrobacter deserti]